MDCRNNLAHGARRAGASAAYASFFVLLFRVCSTVMSMDLHRGCSNSSRMIWNNCINVYASNLRVSKQQFNNHGNGMASGGIVLTPSLFFPPVDWRIQYLF